MNRHTSYFDDVDPTIGPRCGYMRLMERLAWAEEARGVKTGWTATVPPHDRISQVASREAALSPIAARLPRFSYGVPGVHPGRCSDHPARGESPPASFACPTSPAPPCESGKKMD